MTPKVSFCLRPPVLFLGALAVGLALDELRPLPLAWQGDGLTRSAGGALMTAGVAVLVAGIRNFARADTPVPGHLPARRLVTSRIHGWSRNPIYVGMFTVYAGAGLAAASPWMAALALPLSAAMRYRVVAREEAYLEQRFGNHYRDYKTRVRRWL